MNNLSKLGLAIFLTGFGIFNASFFLSTYEIRPIHILDYVYDDGKQSLLENYLKDVLYLEYASSFQLAKDLGKSIEQLNQDQQEIYRINISDVNKIISGANLASFSWDAADQIFNSGDVGEFKISALKSYGSWINGKTYNNEDQLRGDLNNIALNIEKYEIIGKKGFDKYRIKDLKFDLIRAGNNGPVRSHPWIMICLTYGLCIFGALVFHLQGLKEPEGIKNNGMFFSSMANRGWLGILTGSFLISLYIMLYYFPEYMTSWVVMLDPLSKLLNGGESGRFFFYGVIYTIAILVMGVRMMIKYRGNRYQQFRTVSVMFFQTAFAFLIPEILVRLNKPYFDFKNIWPLDYDFFFDTELSKLIDSGALGIFMLGWGIALIIVAVPVMVYFFGKRWYCSWVCGCGGLAETLGDPYRQLSDKTLKAWQIERWMVHGVLVFAIFMTFGVVYTYWTGQSQFIGINSYAVRESYGFWIGAAFAGVVGTGFYPLMGNRVWCRFGCPLAAYLGLIQRFKSRFRITTNGGQCISCGNCSTYCEMGIDVRWYAQRGQNIVRSSCVGCGVCSSVCPRGVLKLENGPEEGRFGIAKLIGLKSKI